MNRIYVRDIKEQVKVVKTKMKKLVKRCKALPDLAPPVALYDLVLQEVRNAGRRIDCLEIDINSALRDMELL